jgi:hypothetical protein
MARELQRTFRDRDELLVKLARSAIVYLMSRPTRMPARLSTP